MTGVRNSFLSASTSSATILIVLALSCAGSCERRDAFVSTDDEPRVASSQDVAPAPSPADPTNAEEAPVPAEPNQPSPSTNELAAPKFDAKGVAVDLTGTGVFNGFVSSEDKARQGKIKVVRGAGLLSIEGLRAFASFPELTEFLWVDARLPFAPGAREAFEQFAAAPKLKKVRLAGLSFENGAFPDYVLPALAKTPNLVDLDLSGSAATADVLSAVDFRSGFQKLEKLNLYHTPTGDAGVAAIADLADRLVSLNFDDANLTPASAANLAKFSRLTFLHVGRSTLDDGCVPELAKLANLKKIHVTRSNVTEDGADKLRAALPGCEVVSQPEK